MSWPGGRSRRAAGWAAGMSASSRTRELLKSHGSVLFKLSHYHTREDVDHALEVVPKAVERLRRISSWKPQPT